ncbi:MAG: hypothetical protein KGY80_13815 [Candidatus Thorarchaeota archaeon]|nr:hypothetical protein [Candidatus Thorarchaeota archaeon]
MRKHTIIIAFILLAVLPPVYQKPVEASESLGKIVFDYSHGQYNSYLAQGEPDPGPDWYLRNNLTTMGYEVVWAFGGLNASVLSGADALLVGAIYGEENGFVPSEIDAVADWFNAGNKFLWIGSDSDYGGQNYINSNMSWMLEEVGSHVYPEPTSMEDPESNCEASYRVVANETSDDPYVEEIVDGVSKVVMHGPTCLYGSTSATAGVDAVALEETDIEHVYPLLYYGDAAYITDTDLLPPYAHSSGDEGPLVATTIETSTGDNGTGTVVVSGASPYGDYKPMYTAEYYDVQLDGYNLVKQAIDWSLTGANDLTSPSIDHPADIEYEFGVSGKSITWSPSDAYPASYTILRNGTIVETDAWDGDNITIDIDDLGPATYNYTIVVFDDNGNNISDTVYVTVMSSSPPTIDEPADVEYELGATGNSITWNPTDPNPDSYEIYRNGSLIESGSWNGSSIIEYIDDLGVARYNYTIIVFDTLGNSATDTVFVTVVSTASTEPTTPAVLDSGLYVLVASIVSAIAIILVVYYFAKIR